MFHGPFQPRNGADRSPRSCATSILLHSQEFARRETGQPQWVTWEVLMGRLNKRRWMRPGSPRTRPWDKNLRARSLHRSWLQTKEQGITQGWKRRQCVFPLWTTRPPPCREPLGDCVEEGSELSHLRTKSWGCICQSFPVAGWGLVEGGVVTPGQSCPLAKHPPTREHLWMERSGAYNGRHCLYHKREWWLPGDETGLQLCLLPQRVPFQPH